MKLSRKRRTEIRSSVLQKTRTEDAAALAVGLRIMRARDKGTNRERVLEDL